MVLINIALRTSCSEQAIGYDKALCLNLKKKPKNIKIFYLYHSYAFKINCTVYDRLLDMFEQHSISAIFRTFNVQTIEYIDKIYQQKSRININDNRDIYRIKRKVIKNSRDIKFLILI